MIIKYLLYKNSNRCIPDSLFHKLANYYLHIRNGIIPEAVHVNNPTTFNDKIISLKIKNRFPYGHILADKYEVRSFVSSTIGKKYLIPIVGLFDNVNYINYEKFPGKFVMKATQGSGWNIIVTDKSKLNIDNINSTLRKWLNMDYSVFGREWQYKKIKPRIIVEKYLDNSTENPLYDYKFFCFNGEPKYIQVDIDRNTNHTRNFYNLKWEKQPFSLLYQNSDKLITRPENLDEMILITKQLAKKLFKDLPFVRIDLYSYENKVYFGEITFHPEGGCAPFKPKKYNKILGDFLKL